jgi:hypothetical protein
MARQLQSDGKVIIGLSDEIGEILNQR